MEVRPGNTLVVEQDRPERFQGAGPVLSQPVTAGEGLANLGTAPDRAAAYSESELAH